MSSPGPGLSHATEGIVPGESILEDSVKQYTVILAVLLTLLLASCGVGETPPAVTIPSAEELRVQSGKDIVEIGYLDHQPMRGVLSEVDTVLASYGDKINVVRYDLDTPEGEAFTKARQVTGHTPIAIFVNGSMEYTLADRKVTFYNFPGDGWRVDDLRTVLDQETVK